MNIFKELYNYRELLKTNVQKEIRGKYKKSFLGIFWSFLNPLLQLAVYAFIFPMILKNNQDNYLMFLFVALIPWTFFTTSLTIGTDTVVQNGNIVKKVYFPRTILPISVVTSAAINFLISTIIVIIFALFTGLGVSIYLLFYPIILIIQYTLTLGIVMALSSITVYLRDLQHIIGVVVQVLFYATPIVYAPSSIPKQFAFILNLNPMSHIITAYRDIFYYKQLPNLINLGIIFLVALIICILGYLIFTKLEKRFAEEL